MKKCAMVMLISLIALVPEINADSFGFYYRSNGFGMGMEFGDYDYYDRYSPGFYDYTEIDFRTALSPYGNWEYLDDFDDYVWIPYVDFSWRPYSNGNWVYSSYGWMWVAYEPWGWIPHHYGRWFMHPFIGWIWIPGYTWAPAHVQWGYYSGHYAWAPLPPDHCRFYAQYNVNYYNHRDYSHYNRYDRRQHHNDYDRSAHWYGRSNDYERSTERWIPNNAWNVVRENDFLSTNSNSVGLSQDRANALIGSGEFKVGPRAPEVSRIESNLGRKVERVKVDEVTKRLPSGERIKVVQPVNVLETRKSEVETVNRQFRELKKENRAMEETRQRNRKKDMPRSEQRPQSLQPSGQPESQRIDRPQQKPQDLQETTQPNLNRPRDEQRVRPDSKPQQNTPQSLNRPNNEKPQSINRPENERPQSINRPSQQSREIPSGRPNQSVNPNEPKPVKPGQKPATVDATKDKDKPVKKGKQTKPETVDDKKDDDDNKNANPLRLN